MEMKNKLLVALVALISLGAVAKAVNLVDKVYAGDGEYEYEWTVRADRQTKFTTTELNANGSLVAGGTYVVKGARTLTTPVSPKIGDKVVIYRGDNGNWLTAPVVITNGTDAALIEDSTSNYTVNGTGLSSATLIYVGTDDGWRVIED